jgi:hypothetical protein
MADIRITTSTIYTVNGVNFTTVAEALKHVEELLTEPVKVIASTTDKDTNTLSKHYPVTLTLLEMFRHGKYDYNIGIYHHAFQNTAEYSVFENDVQSNYEIVYCDDTEDEPEDESETEPEDESETESEDESETEPEDEPEDESETESEDLVCERRYSVFTSTLELPYSDTRIKQRKIVLKKST